MNSNSSSSGGYFSSPPPLASTGSALPAAPQFVPLTQPPDTAGAAKTTESNTRSSLPPERLTGSERDPQAALQAPIQSEFQKFVEAATGRMLPLFGRSFFASSPHAVVDNVPVSSDYVVGPGDELLIRAWGAIDVDYRTSVNRSGQITLPKVGTFTVSGIKAADLEPHLRAQIGRLFTNFDLSVTLGQLRGLTVFVVGPAFKPGVYRLPSQSTLLSAVVAAGGPSHNGSMRNVTLRRAGKVLAELDMYSFLVLGDKSRDVQLAHGDVVVFQAAGPQVALTGAVDTMAIYELARPQERMKDVLRYAGNLPILANPFNARLERIDPARPRSARLIESIRLDEEGMNQPLRDGDVLTVQPISPAFSNAVTLKGYVAEALRHPYKPGMRVLDLIPDTQALISFDFYRRRNALVQVTRVDSIQRRNLPLPLLEEVNWDYATIERLDPTDLSPQLISFHLGQALLQKDPSQNLALQAGDVVSIYSRKDIRGPMANQIRRVSLEGEVVSPGVYQLKPGETLRALVERAGGFTPQAYVYGLEFSREETKLRQQENLTAAVARLEALAAVQSAREAVRNDAAAPPATQNTVSASEASRRTQLARLAQLVPNGRIALELAPTASSVEHIPELPLDNGDRISVPSRPGFVSVAGAVVNNNAYLWKPNRTVGEYVALAGIEETSDIDNMFVLRADGTVTHGADLGGLFSRSLKQQTLYPGDTVVVPNQLDYESWGRALVRNLKDWSQIFYQFGLGAAAITTLKNN